MLIQGSEACASMQKESCAAKPLNLGFLASEEALSLQAQHVWLVDAESLHPQRPSAVCSPLHICVVGGDVCGMAQLGRLLWVTGHAAVTQTSDTSAPRKLASLHVSQLT